MPLLLHTYEVILHPSSKWFTEKIESPVGGLNLDLYLSHESYAQYHRATTDVSPAVLHKRGRYQHDNK